MTERPGQDTATDDLSDSGDAAADAADRPARADRPTRADQTARADQPASAVIEGGAAPMPGRPAARPSPTSRARRTAAAAPDGLRRPSPRPGPAAAPAPAGTPTAGSATAGPVTASPPEAPTAPIDGTGKAGEGTAEKAADHTADGPDGLDGRPADLVSLEPSAAGAGRLVPAWLVAALAVVVLALAGLDGWLLTSQPGSGSRAEREQALSTAKSAVPLILSYNYQRFDADVAAAKARLTGRAVDDYLKAMTKTIKPTATKVHAVVQAQTDGAGVEAVSGNGSQVTVVVFGEQKVTNTSLTAPRIDLFRVRVTLDRVQGQWLVSKFDQI
ncbi:hypothetical protein [Jatrophihabitans sp.]|jgi:Mce-associated membrane protein|uniref:hypothetical protein n=1 Tax=Jatrophihabitans sp. TaxID=1932789 RepID=UPI002EF91619